MLSAGHSNGEIFIVDDDASVCHALELVFTRAGFRVASFGEGTALLTAARSRVPTSIILDVCMPGQSGLDIVKELRAYDYPAPIILMSGQGSVSMAVEAIRSGAVDFIEKPFDIDTVVARIRNAIEASTNGRAKYSPSDIRSLRFPGRHRLTPRECEVLALIVTGATNKEAARHLGINRRTVEVHRGRVMDKVGAKNAADLVRIILTARRDPDDLSAANPDIRANVPPPRSGRDTDHRIS
jgi:two-component system response regulator FixJ